MEATTSHGELHIKLAVINLASLLVCHPFDA